MRTGNGRKIVVVGAGPGGLSAAMLLAAKGFDVEVFEKQDYIGGRTSALEVEGYTFDLGPTFLMMRYILDEIFAETGRRTQDYLDIRRMDPMYRLVLPDGREFSPAAEPAVTEERIEALWPGEGESFRRFMAYEKKKFERLAPCLQMPYSSFTDYLSPRLLKALPYLGAHKSLYDHLGRFFGPEELKLSFTFQAKYLGMSPWECPATFSMIPYVEHAMGVYHPIGGLNRIPAAMAQVVREEGGRIHLGTPVREVLVDAGRARGVLLDDGRTVPADAVVIGADFAHAMSTLVQEEHRPAYTDEALEEKRYSCSTYMLYLGVDRTYETLPHHSILFADDYKANVDEIAVTMEVPRDPSVYVQNASVTDPTLAPAGKSTLYVLVPVPNTGADIDWARESPAFREKILDRLEARGGFEGIRDHIEVMHEITPQTWEQSISVYKGAVFNLAHDLGQMLYKRPHNKFTEFDDCYLVGGGTHPGSGLPTIFESGRIAATLILARRGVHATAAA